MDRVLTRQAVYVKGNVEAVHATIIAAEMQVYIL